MIDALRPFLSRVLSPFIAMLLTYLAGKFGLNFGEDAQGYFTETAIAVLVPVFLAMNAIIHKSLDKWLNPGDAASSHLADKEAGESSMLKQKEKVRRRKPAQ